MQLGVSGPGPARDPAFLADSRVMAMLLVWGTLGVGIASSLHGLGLSTAHNTSLRWSES